MTKKMDKKHTIIVVTVTKDNKTTKERFLTKEAAEKWIDYKKNVEHSTAEYTSEEQPAGILETVCTYECKWFPTGRETKDRIELAKGIKLGLTPGTWIPDPNPVETIWRPKSK